jgi:hypothetical protein
MPDPHFDRESIRRSICANVVISWANWLNWLKRWRSFLAQLAQSRVPSTLPADTSAQRHMQHVHELRTRT